MKSLYKYFTKLFVPALFIAFLALNVQVGMGGGNDFLESNGFSFQTAKAGNCDPGYDRCSTYTFPDGKTYWEYGEIIVVTPDKKLK